MEWEIKTLTKLNLGDLVWWCSSAQLHNGFTKFYVFSIPFGLVSVEQYCLLCRYCDVCNCGWLLVQQQTAAAARWRIHRDFFFFAGYEIVNGLWLLIRKITHSESLYFGTLKKCQYQRGKAVWDFYSPIYKILFNFKISNCFNLNT